MIINIQIQTDGEITRAVDLVAIRDIIDDLLDQCTTLDEALGCPDFRWVKKVFSG